MAAPQLIVRVAANLSEFRTNLAEGLSQIETTKGALSSMSSAFDGSKILAQAGAVQTAIHQVGGATNLTRAEQEKANAILQAAIDKYALLGRQAPTGMQALADATKQAEQQTDQFTRMVERLTERFAVFELLHGAIDFAKSAIEDTARIEELSLATGISTDAIQRLSYVGKAFGVDAEQMARGVEQLSAKLANGDRNAVSAVQGLGLSVKGLIAAGPEEAFLQIAEAVGRLEDPMTKNGIAAELFGGKLAKVLIPMLGNLRQALLDVPKDVLISDDNIKAVHSFEVALAQFNIRAKAWTASVIAGTDAHWGLEGAIAALPAPLAVVAQYLLSNSHAMVANTAAAVAGAAAGEHGNTVTKETTSNADVLENKLKALHDDAVAPLTRAQKENIDTLHSYGVSLTEIAKLVESNEVAVKLYMETEKKAAEEAKHAAEVEKAGLLEVSKLWDEFNQVVGDDGATAFEKQVNAIDRWAEDLEAKAQKAGTDTAAFYEALTELWNAKLNAAAQSSQHATAAAAAGAEEASTAFEDWNNAIMNVTRALDGTIIDTEALAAAQKKLHDTGGSVDLAHAARDPDIMALLHEGWSLENAQAIMLGRKWNFTPKLYDALGNLETAPSRTERVPGYQTGGPTVEGPAILHGGEYVVPKEGALVSGGSGGGTHIIQLVVDGRVLASIVDDHTTKHMRQSRQWPAS